MSMDSYDTHPGAEDGKRASPADLFTAMAEQISRNDLSKFGGAVVVVPPGAETSPLSFLVLDPASQPGQFWATLHTRIQIAVAELEEKARSQQARFR